MPGAEQLRRAVHALDLPDFAEPAEVLTLTELHDAASGAWSDYLAGRHTELLAGLPALMVYTRRAVHALADDHAAEAAGLLATSYRLAAGLSGRLGLVDLAAHAAHRAFDTAQYTTRPELDEAAALRYLAWVLVRQGALAEAERIAVRAAERLDGGLLARPDSDRVGVFGSLLFNAASAAARQGSPGRADDLLRAVSAAAARSGIDRVDETGVFGLGLPRCKPWTRPCARGIRTGRCSWPPSSLTWRVRCRRSGSPGTGCTWPRRARTWSGGATSSSTGATVPSASQHSTRAP